MPAEPKRKSKSPPAKSSPSSVQVPSAAKASSQVPSGIPHSARADDSKGFQKFLGGVENNIGSKSQISSIVIPQVDQHLQRPGSSAEGGVEEDEDLSAAVGDAEPGV